MNYTKPALTLEQQADQLISRGLTADTQQLIGRLKVVNYYRLTGYLHPFRVRDAAGRVTDAFVPGTTLDTVWRRYNFDRRLRIILLDAVERIEVAVRTRIVYHFVQAHGPFGYLQARNLPRFRKRSFWDRLWRNFRSLTRCKGLERSEYRHWLTKLLNEKNRASEPFVKHFSSAYGDEHLPLWMACELMSCETALQMAYGVDTEIIRMAAADFGFPDQQLLSWTKAIFALRNACAHHARVWNRSFGVKPSVPGKNKNPKWHTHPGFAPDRAGLMMTVCHFWLGKVSPTTKWKQRLFALFDEYPEIPLREMGLPADWRSHPLWI